MYIKGVLVKIRTMIVLLSPAKTLDYSQEFDVQHTAPAFLSDSAKLIKELKVKDIMTSKPFSLTTEASVEEVAQVLSLGNYHAIPILENDKLVGIVSTADIIKFFLNKAS